MRFPGEQALREERRQIVATLAALPDDQFNHGPTLCTDWTPRDILAHLLGTDADLAVYVKRLGNIPRANDEIVARYRELAPERLMELARDWASRPALTSRSSALFLLGDAAMHHQDILRGQGRNRRVPDPSANAILREALVVLGGARKLLRYRVEPTDGGVAMGRGETVRGTREALGMWLGGRTGIESDLEFVRA